MIQVQDIAKETVEILKYTDSNFTSKISKKVLDFLQEVSEKSDITVNIDVNKKLSEQDISEQCKDLISLLYYNYCANETEKKEILKIWKENDNLYQRDLEEEYNVEKIFENKKKKTNSIDETKLPMVIKEIYLKK